MEGKKIFTYVSPQTNQEVAAGLCYQLPIIIQPINAVEELFPLLSNVHYHTDFVCVSIDMFYQRADGLDIFDIIRTLATLIKGTVCRMHTDSKPQKRDTKIFVVVDDTTDPALIKEVMHFPDIVSIGWILTKQEDYPSTLEHINNMINGDYTPHRKVLELIKPKKKVIANTNRIVLTIRQQQILNLIQTRGASNKIIAKILGISESTVKLHIGAILKKYGAKNRTQLAIFSTSMSPTLLSV